MNLDQEENFDIYPISLAEWKYIELKGYMSSVDDVPRFGIKKGWVCMNCKSMIYYTKCPTDTCYNFYMYTNYKHIKELDDMFWETVYKQHPELKEKDNETK